MELFSKFRFKWREPKEFVEERDSNNRKASKWWHQVLGVAIGIISLLLLWFLATLDPKKEPLAFEYAFLLAILFGFFLVYVAPWMNRLCPSMIGLSRKRLTMMRGNSGRSEKWGNIESFGFVEGRGFPILRLQLRSGSELQVGLDSSVQPDDVRLFLRDVGVSPGNSESGRNGD